MSFIEEIGFPRPTQVRHSGNGIYCDWLYSEVWRFASDADWSAAANLSKRLQAARIAAGQKLRGWKIDTTSDLARIARMPGTKNYKTNPPKDVTLLDIGCGARYSVEELEASIVKLETRFCQPAARAKSKTGWTPRDSSSSDAAAANDNEPRLESVVAGCAWAALATENAEQMPEPDWYALASIAGRCRDGEALFHDISAKDPRYSSDETQQKLSHALEAAGPRTCANISESFGGCRNCPFNGKISSPIRLGYVNEVEAELMRTHVFDIATQTYVDVRSGRCLDAQQFNSKFQHEMAEAPHRALMKNDLTKKVEQTLYLAGNDNRFVEQKGEPVLNTWRNESIAAEPDGDASIILGHVNFLLPREEDVNHFLDCLASIVQRPSDKIRHALLIISGQGIGKTFFHHLFVRMFGDRDVNIVDSDVLHSEWNTPLVDKRILVMEELMTDARKEVYNRLKPLLSDETILANEKHIRRREAMTPRAVMAFSNHAVPVSLEMGDRRFWIVRSEAARRDKDYYDRLFGEGLSQAGAFLHYLGMRDISRFNPSAPPPMTDAKAAIISDSRPRVEQVLRELLDSEHPSLCKDVVAVSHIRLLVQIETQSSRFSNNQLTEALRAVGGVNLGQVRLGHERRERLWAIRNAETWETASHEELRAYLGQQA